MTARWQSLPAKAGYLAVIGASPGAGTQLLRTRTPPIRLKARTISVGAFGSTGSSVRTSWPPIKLNPSTSIRTFDGTLKSDPEAWADYQAEMAIWDSALMDGLQDNPWEGE